MARLNYLELPVDDTGRAKAFYEAAFGWRVDDFGPTYAATTTGDTDVGFQADPQQRTAAPLPVIDVDDLEAAQAAVGAAGRVDHDADIRLSRWTALPLPRSRRA